MAYLQSGHSGGIGGYAWAQQHGQHRLPFTKTDPVTTATEYLSCKQQKYTLRSLLWSFPGELSIHQVKDDYFGAFLSQSLFSWESSHIPKTGFLLCLQNSTWYCYAGTNKMPHSSPCVLNILKNKKRKSVLLRGHILQWKKYSNVFLSMCSLV